MKILVRPGIVLRLYEGGVLKHLVMISLKNLQIE